MKIDDLMDLVVHGTPNQLYELEFSSNKESEVGDEGVALISFMFKKQKEVFAFSSATIVSAVCSMNQWCNAHTIQLATISYERLAEFSKNEEFLHLLTVGLKSAKLHVPKVLSRDSVREECF